MQRFKGDGFDVLGIQDAPVELVMYLLFIQFNQC